MHRRFWLLMSRLADWLLVLVDAHMPPVPGGPPDYDRIQRRILCRLAADALDDEEAEREADAAAMDLAAGLTHYPLDD